MNRVWGSIARPTAALGVCLAATDAHADTVELTNGDTLTGKVVEQTDAGVSLEHPALGQIVLPADRVKAVKIDPPAGDKPKPQAQPAPQPKPAPQPQPDPARVKKDAQAAADDHASGLGWFFQDWDNKLALGFSGAGGNTQRQNYYAKFNTKYEDGNDRWNISSQWLYATADGDKTQNQFQANLTRDWLKKDRPWFFFLKGTYKYDEQRAWENRTSAFGGGGYTLAKNEKVEVNTRLGFGGTYEFGSVNEFTPEALFGGSVVKWHINERAALSGEAIYYPSLEDSAAFRIENKLEWTYKLDMADGLSLKIGMQNEYDSRTPNDSQNNDLNYYGALVLDF